MSSSFAMSIVDSGCVILFFWDHHSPWCSEAHCNIRDHSYDHATLQSPWLRRLAISMKTKLRKSVTVPLALSNWQTPKSR